VFPRKPLILLLIGYSGEQWGTLYDRPDADSKAREYRCFVDDLKIAAALLQKSTHAA
jgi:hypothetical protein